MHAACMWSRDAEVVMPWEGEAGLVCGMEGCTQPGAAPGACSNTSCWDSVTSRASRSLTAVPGTSSAPKGLPDLRAGYPQDTHPAALSLLLLPSQGKTEGWMYRCLPHEGCACLCSLFVL